MSTEKSEMAADIDTTLFPHNRVLTTLMVIIALLLGLCGIFNYTRGRAALSLMWFGGAVLVYINYWWRKKTPHIQLSEKGLILFPAVTGPQQMTPWDAIAALQQIGDKTICLKLTNGERMKVNLFSINKEDRIPLVNNIASKIGSIE